MDRLNEEELEKFLSKTKRDYATGCLIWTGSTDKDGYGSFCLKGDKVRAHRVAYAHFVENPDGFVIRHSYCDNPPCVEPTHLHKGTVADNNYEKEAKGRERYACGDENGSRTHPERHSKGENHYNAKLSWEKVRIIREKYLSSSFSQSELAAEFGVSQGTINELLNNEIWKDASYSPNFDMRRSKQKRGETSPSSKLSEQIVCEIRKSDLKQVDLAKKYGVSQGTISSIIRKQSWKHIGDD